MGVVHQLELEMAEMGSHLLLDEINCEPYVNLHCKFTVKSIFKMTRPFDPSKISE